MQDTGDTKCWLEWAATELSSSAAGNANTVQPLWKTVRRFLTKLNVHFPCDGCSNCAPCYLPKGAENFRVHKNQQGTVYSSSVHEQHREDSGLESQRQSPKCENASGFIEGKCGAEGGGCLQVGSEGQMDPRAYRAGSCRLGGSPSAGGGTFGSHLWRLCPDTSWKEEATWQV